MNIDLHDDFLKPDGPVAIVVRENLEPVCGEGTVVFPPTFAAAENSKEKPDYIIDGDVCLMDTVGSQGNRLEPMFKSKPLMDLVPQVTVKVGERRVNLLDLGHRAADAVIRFSGLGHEIAECFLEYRKGNATKLAKLAPTSLVFGAWDSRGTGAKIPRLVESSVRAFGVQKLSRAAQYFGALQDEERQAVGATSEEGLLDTPSGRGPGGVIARGGIRRDAVLNLVALRTLRGEDQQALQRYVLGLALSVFALPGELYLRQGCLLVSVTGGERKIVGRDGSRTDFLLCKESALEYAKIAANAFGVGLDRETEFNGPSRESRKKGK